MRMYRWASNALGRFRNGTFGYWSGPGPNPLNPIACCLRRIARRRTPALRAARLLQLIELQDLDARRACLHIAVCLDPVVKRLLLAADLFKSLAHVGIEARAVTERRIEDMFHAGLLRW